MKNKTVEEQLQKVAETLSRLHDKLMSFPYSFEENKQQGRRILRCVRFLYKSYTALKCKD